MASASMGRRQKPRAKLDHQEDEGEASSSKSFIFLSSSDDEEANEDLSLKIVEKAIKRAAMRDQDAILDGRSIVVDLVSSASEEAEEVTYRNGPTGDDDAAVKGKKGSRKQRRTNKNLENKEKTVSIFIFSACFMGPG